VQFENVIAHGYRVAGVVAAIVTGDDVSFGRQHVGDVTLAFITPLSANNDI
jgi:hypothetical protein